MGLNFSGMMNASLNVLTKPSTASFEAAKSTVNTTSTVVGLAAAGAITGLIAGLVTAFGIGAGVAGLIGGMIGGVIGGVIGALIGFYVIQAVVFVVAKVFGGTGGYMDQANLMATFYVPLLIVSALLGLIPVVGAILGFVVLAYELFLTGLGLQVAQSLPSQKAWLAVVVLVVLYIVFVVFLAAAVFAIVAGLGLLGGR
ncbi:MAG: YIP1 family protein [Chloroflexi bacterium]|nr:YIP1 family protein [Chloroflexota bacterium]MBI3738090.1 YIP1 family protein [Chloroflexota bacterium]